LILERSITLSKKKKKKEEVLLERKPWIPKKTGLIAMTIVSVALAGWVAWQVISVEDNIGKGILWGVIFGASIWLVFFGMNFFHRAMGGKK
jgi:hypothetical protein